MILRPVLGCASLAVLAAPGAFAQATLATSSEYSTGSYGETTDTTLLYAAVSAGWSSPEWSFEATLPWVQPDGPATFLGPDVPPARGTTGRSPGDEVEGFADVGLSLTRTVDLSADGATRLDITGRVQVPTGEEDKGLSSGDVRTSLGLDLSQDVLDW